jgi:hypothetical protein
METEKIDKATYHWALYQAESFKSDRLNSVDQRMHWSPVHSLLARHSPADGDLTCNDCSLDWPCAVVRGAVTDLPVGPAGS